MNYEEWDENLFIPMSDHTLTLEALHERALAVFSNVGFITMNGTTSKELATQTRARARMIFSPQVTALRAAMGPYTGESGYSGQQIRDYIKLKLIELTMSEKEVTQLRALELLGKVADVAAFSENINVNVQSKSKEELEADLMNKLGRFLETPIVEDVQAIGQD